MTESSPRPSFVRWLYTHNPFYAISAVLMLYSVRASYGELQIGLINCWMMMGILATYTLVLAGVGVCIVRLGKVWEDARSILLLLLLLFLAVSISADDLFVKAATPEQGTLLLVGGFLFSTLVSIGVIKGLGIRVGWEYAVPYVLYLGLFFAHPWWCSPELHPRATRWLNWTVFLFPQIAALINLTLLPAVRRGAKAVVNNGTPWPWPWFPWITFGVLFVAVAIRSFALAMTFGQTGPIWGDIQFRSGINFDTIWGPYFLIPFVLSILFLGFEGALTAGRSLWAQRLLLFSPLSLLCSIPWSDRPAAHGFLTGHVATVIGTPLWSSVWLLLAFFGWATLKQVKGATTGFCLLVGMLAFVQADTVSLHDLRATRAEPLFAASLLCAIAAIRQRSSLGGMMASALLAYSLWLVLPQTSGGPWRFAICYHLLLVATVLIGLSLQDRFSQILRLAGAAWLPLSSLGMMTDHLSESVPVLWKLVYVAGLTAFSVACAKHYRNRWYLWAATGTTATLGYGVLVLGFRSASSVIGQTAMTAMSWSVAALLIGFLISAHKARWLPPRLFPRWPNGDEPGP